MGEPSSGEVPGLESRELSEDQQVGEEADLDVQKSNDLPAVEAVSAEEQAVPKLPENEEMTVAEGEQGSEETLPEKPIDGQNSELLAEVDSKDDSGLVEASVDQLEMIPGVEVIEAEGDIVETAEIAVMLEHHDKRNLASVSQMEIDSNKSNGVEVKSVGFVGTQSPNGHVVAEADVIESLKDEYNDMPVKEENIEELSAPVQPFTFDFFLDGYGSGTEEEQDAFIAELENFYKSKSMDFKPPKFYGEALNCLKLWRAVTKLGGYEKVTSCKLWRQVGESFKPPKTCTTISWTFRNFYEKALLEYEKHKIQTGELQVPPSNALEPASVDNQVGASQGSGSGRARRDAAARAMQGWHSQRLLGNGEVGDPIIKEKGQLKRKKGSSLDRGMKVARTNDAKPHEDIMVDDAGEPADWVKINMRRTKDCFEIYALVPGLLREEVQVQSDPAGRLIITGDPEQPDNPWGVTPFKKIITLPSRIDPHQTSAVVTLHGQLFIRAPFEQSDL